MALSTLPGLVSDNSTLPALPLGLVGLHPAANLLLGRNRISGGGLTGNSSRRPPSPLRGCGSCGSDPRRGSLLGPARLGPEDPMDAVWETRTVL